MESKQPVLESDLFLNARQTGERYGNASNSTLARWVKAGIIPAPIYFGTRKLWRLSDLLAFEAKRAAESQASTTEARHARA